MLFRSGVTKDLNKAREWYTKAVAQGDAEAQNCLDRLNGLPYNSSDEEDNDEEDSD